MSKNCQFLFLSENLLFRIINKVNCFGDTCFIFRVCELFWQIEKIISITEKSANNWHLYPHMIRNYLCLFLLKIAKKEKYKDINLLTPLHILKLKYIHLDVLIEIGLGKKYIPAKK